jgi:hypothetical protein
VTATRVSPANVSAGTPMRMVISSAVSPQKMLEINLTASLHEFASGVAP